MDGNRKATMILAPPNMQAEIPLGFRCPECGSLLRVRDTRRRPGQEVERLRVCIECEWKIKTVEKPSSTNSTIPSH